MKPKRSWVPGVFIAFAGVLIFGCLFFLRDNLLPNFHENHQEVSRTQTQVSPIPPQPSTGKRNATPPPVKDGMYAPSTISLDHHFFFPTVRVILALFGGLILCSVVGFVVGAIFAKKFLGEGLRPEITAIEGQVRKQRGGLFSQVKPVETDGVKRKDIDRLRTDIEGLHSEVRKIKALLGKQGARPQVKDQILEKELTREQRQSQFEKQKATEIRAPAKTPKSLEGLLADYNKVDTGSHKETDDFMRYWDCKEIEALPRDPISQVEFEPKERGSFFSVSIDNFSYILPNFFSAFDEWREMILKKCFEIEGQSSHKWAVIEPATASVISDRSLRLKDMGRIKFLEADLREQPAAEQKGQPLEALPEFNIENIVGGYNKALHDEALRASFLKLYPWETPIEEIEAIGLRVEKNCFLIFPSFDQLISGKGMGEDLKKLFIAPSGVVIRGIGDIERIRPAKMRGNKIESRGQIIIKERDGQFSNMPKMR